MVQFVLEHLGELRTLCRKFHVAELYLFGSATNDRFKPDTSDLDFLVHFAPMPPFEHADAYWGLISALEGLFNRRVDLVDERAIKNPYFREEVEETRVKLYAA